MPIKFYYVYILLSLHDENFYIGLTNDLKRRLSEHKRGKNISTAKRLPLRLIYFFKGTVPLKYHSQTGYQFRFLSDFLKVVEYRLLLKKPKFVSVIILNYGDFLFFLCYNKKDLTSF